MRTEWMRNGAGWHVTTVRGVFIALMRDGASWRWLGFANGHPLGRFNGLVEAKRKAPKQAAQYERTTA